MPNETKRIFEFGEFRLDTKEQLLWAGDKALTVTPKVFDLLVLLVENPGRLLEKDWILQSLWPDTFVEEANLSVNISTLRKILGPAGSSYIETVPKRGYRFTATVREIVVGPEPSSDSQPIEPIEIPRPSRRPLRLIVVAAAVIVVLASYLLVKAGRNRAISKVSEVRSMAVLPFRPLVQGHDDDYLGPGMADALIVKLSMVQKIMVRSTAAVLRYYGGTDPIAAGRELRVDVVLDGTVQHVGKMVRVSVQLLRVSDGSPLWAERFDDDFTNLFEVQDRISEKVANALSMKLTEGERQQMLKRQTVNNEAYQLYVKARYVAFKRSSDASPEAAIDLYQQAISKDPDYAAAYAGLAAAYMELATMRGQLDVIAKARAAAMRGVSLDDSLADAHIAAGGVLMRGDWDWAGARREFDKALSSDPHAALAHWSKSLLLMALGETGQSLTEMQTAQRFDPGSATIQDDLAWALYCNRRWEEAIQASKMAVAMGPDSFAAHHQLGKAYLQARQYEPARTEFATTLRLHKFKRGLADLGQLEAVTGNISKARAILAQLDEADRTNPTYETAYMHAVLYGSLGEKDAAFKFLNAACDQRLSRAIWIKVDPDLEPLRQDPRFEVVLRRIQVE